ncbi:MAG TPA: aldo/keto reductase [Anaerolineales bacterium]|nr:aldo/keto reductase [Anaerolineales bacterium]
MITEMEKIDPASVPHRTLYTGAKIPAVGLGTFGSDRFSPGQIAEAVLGAAQIGYRHFDCAAVYGNEKEIGFSLQKAIKGGIKREELWVTSKLWNDKHAEADVIPACQQTLHDLQLKYLDLYLVHWPFPNHHAPGVDVNSRDPHAIPYIHSNFMKTWRQMEKLVAMGLVRHIGTSNMTIPKLKLLLQDAKYKPAANEMELHPHFQQPEFFKYCMDNAILPIGFAPIGSPTRPDRDKSPDDTVDIQDPVIIKIAARLNVHPAVVCIKWAVQRGQVPIPFSIHPREYLSNLKAATVDPLTEEEMQEIAGTNKNNRLIKGQVFLWEHARDWKELWDLDGKIAS